MQFDVKKHQSSIYKYIIGLCTLAMLSAIGVYSYLGTYSRYLADDYCEAVRVNKSSPISAVIERYQAGDWRAANRYSNLMFVGFSELLGRDSMQITMTSMVLLWVVGLSWSIHEIRKYLKINLFFQMDIFIGATLGFFSLLQAPNLFQTVYWRSSMMTHFAPLVFGCFLFAFLLRQTRRRKTSLLVNVFIFFAAFIFAGFSEPPTTTTITALPLVMLAIWYWGKSPDKQKHIVLFAWALAGVILGLLVMAFSPAATNTIRETRPNISLILLNSFYYGYLFIIDSLKTMPLPFFVSTLTFLLVVWLYPQDEAPKMPNQRRWSTLLIMIAIPFLAWLLIAAGFAPSVFGQGFPVERMRFLATTIMIVTFMLEGALLGYLPRDKFSIYSRPVFQWLALALFSTLAIVYPLRAAYNIYKTDVPEYRSHAEAWDQRDAEIRKAVAEGATDLVVVQLDSMKGVLEYKKNNWVNICAANYYGLNSISAPLEVP
ncbi:MAG: hypothetical protein HZB50_11585 [Chloroflexi bacterium]|nr:hypothetical protein [Chloroflexota bacterium]